MRLGLCCIFRDEPVRFRTTTARHLLTLSAASRLEKLDQIAIDNVTSLKQAFEVCDRLGVKSFRILSSLFPLRTHPQVGYTLEDLPSSKEILRFLRTCRDFAGDHGLRLSFHPDQFVVLNSPRPEVVANSVADLVYHAEMAELLGADVINIHGGGAYGNKQASLERLANTFKRLPRCVKERLTLENDEKTYSPSDLVGFCSDQHIPFVYDIHHHRCYEKSRVVDTEKWTQAAMETWDREPLFHVSSPLEGWDAPNPHRHHDFIDPTDFPREWLDLPITVDVEAKAKESAVLKLGHELERMGNTR